MPAEALYAKMVALIHVAPLAGSHGGTLSPHIQESHPALPIKWTWSPSAWEGVLSESHFLAQKGQGAPPDYPRPSCWSVTRA